MKYQGRDVIDIRKFTDLGTWSGFNAAKAWLKENGYSYGSTSHGSHPMGFIHANEWPYTQKWHNMSKDEQKSVHGVMIGDIREGPVTLLFFSKPHLGE